MRTPLLAALACTFTLGAVGCQGKLTEIIPKDLSAHLADGGNDSGGGPMVDLGPPHFSTDIQTSLNMSSCAASATGCHQSPNGNQPLFVYMATMDTDIMSNFMSFQNECDMTNPSMSAILLNPLNTPGTSHSGGTVWTDGTSDPTYKLWLSWITDGELY